MRVALFYALWLSSSVYALLAGGRTERFGVAIALLIGLGPLALRSMFPISVVQLDQGMLIVDALATPACYALALRSDRHWTLWFCAAQTVALLAHIARTLLSDEAGLAYWVMTRVPGYIQCVSLLLGTLCYHLMKTRRPESNF